MFSSRNEKTTQLYHIWTFISMFHLTQHILTDRNSIILDLGLRNFGNIYRKS